MSNKDLFGRIDYEDFKRDFRKVFSMLEIKYNLDISMVGARWNSTTMNIEVAVGDKEVHLDETGRETTLEEIQFRELCGKFNFKPEDYGKKVFINDEPYYLVGFKPNAKKYKYIVKKDMSDTKSFKCDSFDLYK